MADDGKRSYSLQLPTDLYDTVYSLARQHNRSINGEIAHALAVYARQEQRRAEFRRKLGQMSEADWQAYRAYLLGEDE